MLNVEGVAWATKVLGEDGPHVREAVPQVLYRTHSQYSATQRGLGLESAHAYGLIWLGFPKELVEEFDGMAGVQIHRPHNGRYRLPVINGVPLIPWRYSKDTKTELDRVPFGHPVSASRASLFEPIQIPQELPLGEEGLGAAVVEQMTPEERAEMDTYGKEIAILAGAHRCVAVIAYASNPDSLLTCVLGYASLKDDGCLDWAYREPLPVTAAADRRMRAATTGNGRPAFDAGTPAAHILRARNPLEGMPTGTPVTPPDATATDDE